MRVFTNEEFTKLKEVVKEHYNSDWWSISDEPIFEVDLKSYHPEYRDKVKPFLGLYGLHLGSIIYQVTPKEHDVLLNKKQATELRLILDKIIASDEFKADLKDRYNAFKYEYTIYCDAMITELSGGHWYIHNEQKEYLPIDCEEGRANESLNELKERAEKSIKHIEEVKGFKTLGYSISKRYKEVHFLSEEWKEIKELCGNRSGIDKNRHPTHQANRYSKEFYDTFEEKRKKEFKEVVLKSTNRKMLMDVHTWGYGYVDLTPVVK